MPVALGPWVFGKQRRMLWERAWAPGACGPDRETASRVGLAVHLVARLVVRLGQKLRETASLTFRPGAGPESQVAGV